MRTIKKRSRTENWNIEEKKLLQELVKKHLNIIEDKGNDLKIIAKKNKVWDEIEQKMKNVGFNREKKQIRDQWSRLKLLTKSNSISNNFCENIKNLNSEINMGKFECLEYNSSSSSTFDLFEEPIRYNKNKSTVKLQTNINTTSVDFSPKVNKVKELIHENHNSNNNDHNRQIEIEIEQSRELHQLKMKVQQKLLEKIELEIEILRKTEKRNEQIHSVKIEKTLDQ